MYSSADLIITPTPYSKKLIEGYGFNKKVLAISNGIDLKEYAPIPKRCGLSRAFSLQEGEKT
jgi:1,2-diacylglycerol-3-alpha-glucose alpha-1,2-glucosyltransferase